MNNKYEFCWKKNEMDGIFKKKKKIRHQFTGHKTEMLFSVKIQILFASVCNAYKS